jgi:hypothetical protein
MTSISKMGIFYLARTSVKVELILYMINIAIYTEKPQDYHVLSA